MSIYISGIDEAGRGPCIGPLVLVGVKVDIRTIPELKKLGVKDSKKLSRSGRERLRHELESILEEVEYYVVNPEEIVKKRLTRLEIEGIAYLIQKIEASEYIIDAIVNRRAIPNLMRELRLLVGERKARIRMEPYADSRYVVVASASILAKLRRDQEIDKLHEIYGDFGSGYPSDPKTVNFLLNYKDRLEELSKIIRADWKTIERLKSKSLELKIS